MPQPLMNIIDIRFPATGRADLAYKGFGKILMKEDVGNRLSINMIVDGMELAEESPLDFPSFQSGELAKRRRNVIKRLTVAASDAGDIQLFCSHSWRGRDPKIQSRKFRIFSSLTRPAQGVSSPNTVTVDKSC